MKKRSIMAAIISTVIVLIVAVFSVNSQDEIKYVQDSAFKERMRPPVSFLHDKHNETAQIEDCGKCHHVYQDGKLVDGEASEGTECSECHTLQTDKNPIPLAKTYHLQCKGCHMEKKAGPILCGECHAKQN